MKLTVLIDNHTLIDRYLTGEPGLCLLVEDEDKKILFDLGYSAAFLRNADILNISLADIDYIVFSHGHLDHTWGLQHLIDRFTSWAFLGKKFKRPMVIAHPLVFAARKTKDGKESGSLIPLERVQAFFDVRLTAEPFELTRNLLYLGEIKRNNNFEAQKPVGKIYHNGATEDDYMMDDSALVYRSSVGLVVITGCSHAGICNIVEYAGETCGTREIRDIVGGLHLLDPGRAQLQGTLDYMKQLHPAAVHACHCTDLRSKIALAGVVNLQEVGTGLTIEYT